MITGRILRGFKKGDYEADEEIIKRYKQRLLTFARELIGRRVKAAGEIVDEAFDLLFEDRAKDFKRLDNIEQRLRSNVEKGCLNYIQVIIKIATRS